MHVNLTLELDGIKKTLKTLDARIDCYTRQALEDHELLQELRDRMFDLETRLAFKDEIIKTIPKEPKKPSKQPKEEPESI